jgi:hypothetical protein
MANTNDVTFEIVEHIGVGSSFYMENCVRVELRLS